MLILWEANLLRSILGAYPELLQGVQAEIPGRALYSKDREP